MQKIEFDTNIESNFYNLLMIYNRIKEWISDIKPTWPGLYDFEFNNGYTE